MPDKTKTSPGARLRRHLALIAAGALCSGCVTQYKVTVEFSPLLRDHFTEYPTIEVDIAAVTDGEADEVKQAGVEKYFSPDSGFRSRLQSQTCFFSQEDQAAFVLPSRAPVWRQWRLKNPANILVIASLPQDGAMTPQADPRYLLVKMKRSYILARTLAVLVEPKKIIQLSRSQAKAKTNKPQTAEQWIEER
ncbi:MAG: hypothetical protein LBD37_06885 [Treponema sp.]|jgi:hypothetical protein|nr:hypothetical protein [Treponema sp.]